MHISVVPEMFALIFKSAFTPKMDDELAFLLAEAHHNLGQLEGLTPMVAAGTAEI